ncbi:hypothetical protein BV898_15321 [Hypsibius exemplaris]|uniref:Uncharacterized protein n=1 Tax=Hypsibius exemplaris TaxID=2072580 RepID=A0A9X6NBC8_HYPEX|nr:hypothetical protein BV898_15321 [Hypsibius exemplaris]
MTLLYQLTPPVELISIFEEICRKDILLLLIIPDNKRRHFLSAIKIKWAWPNLSRHYLTNEKLAPPNLFTRNINIVRNLLCKENGITTQYDPTVLTCFGDRVCKNGQLPLPATTSGCYDPTSHFYEDGKRSPIRNLWCKENGKTIHYDPAVWTCFGDRKCKNGQLPNPSDNTTCYDPRTHFFADGKTWPIGRALCKKNGKTVYYDPTVLTCFGDRVCKNGQLPNPSDNTTCYDPRTHFFVDGKTWPIGRTLCKDKGKTSNYDPAAWTCFGDRACRNGQLPVPSSNSDCYDPRTHFYAEGLIWPILQNLCKENGTTVSYNPAVSTCFGDRSCPNGELPKPFAVSGCNDPTRSFYEGGVSYPVKHLICKENGHTVHYDPAVSTCFGDRICKNGYVPDSSVDGACFRVLNTANITESSPDGRLSPHQ